MRWRRLAMLAVVAATGIAAAGSHHRVLSAIDVLEPGEWSLRDPNGEQPLRRVCLGDGMSIMRLYHAADSCSHHILDDDVNTGTISYICPGAGHGQTMVSVETPRLFHLHTQGLAHGVPFDVAYEARLVGPCGGESAR